MADSILIECCRACSSRISFALSDGGVVNIILGVPASQVKYKAISHVWGDVTKMPMSCKQCGAVSLALLKSSAYFENIMALAGADSNVWLDNISIDQDDPDDIAAQIAVMGDIYSHAQTVLVLLPASDREAYNLIARILRNANELVDERWKLNYLGGDLIHELKQPDGTWQSIGPETLASLQPSTLARTFFEDVEQLTRYSKIYKYWQRAWTFQEWSLAYEIEVGLESSDLPRLRNVKSLIVYVALMLADYKMRLGDSVLIGSGLTRGDVLQRVA